MPQTYQEVQAHFVLFHCDYPALLILNWVTSVFNECTTKS